MKLKKTVSISNRLLPSRVGKALTLLVIGVYAVAAQAGPAIMSPEPVFDFGELDNEQQVERTFVIKNVGDEPLEITDVKTSCGCTVAKLENKTIQPGGEESISATFNLKGKQGIQSKKITIMSNDPEQPNFYLEFKGTALATISIEPKLLNMGRIMDNDTHSASLTVASSKEGHTFTIEKVEVEQPAAFTTSVETVVPGKEYRVIATTNPNMAEGTLNGRITITTDDPDRRFLNVAVYGHVIGELTLRPDTVTLRGSSAPDAPKATQYLQVLPGRTSDFELLEVLAPIEGMKAELIKRKDNDYHIKLSEMPVDNTLNDKELIVKTNLPGKPEIRIPFRVLPESPIQAGRTPTRVPVARPVVRQPGPPKPPVAPN